MKELQSVIFKVMSHYDMVEKNTETKSTVKHQEIDIFDIDMVKTQEVKNTKDDINMIIQSRVNIQKMITMFEKQGIDSSELKNKLENINIKIQNIFKDMDEEEITYEKYDQCVDIYNMLKDQGLDEEVELIKQKVNALKCKIPTFSINGMMNTKHQKIGITYEDPNARIVNFHQDDNKVNKLIKQVNAEYTDINKERDEFIQQQNQIRSSMIESSICDVASLLNINDVEFIVNNIQKHFKQNWFKIQDMDNIKNNIGKIVGKCSKKLKEEQINLLTIILCKIIASIYVLVEKSNSYDFEEIYKNNYRKDIFKETEEQYVGKNFKVISGPRKGRIGTVTVDIIDYVIMTKDIYGQNIGTTVPTVEKFKIKKTDIKKIKCQYETPTETFNGNIYRQLFKMVKETDGDLFSLSKYITVCISEDQQDTYDNFDSLFSYALELYNKIKKDQIKLYNQYNKSAQQVKKLQKEVKSSDIDPEDFITKQKELKNIKAHFIKLNKMIKSLNINKSNLFFGFNKSNIKFTTETEIEEEIEYLMIKDTSGKYLKKKQKRKTTHYTKENKVMVIKKSIHSYNNYMNILEQL